ncbi:hypothetical protein ABZ772_19810 [Streptomyces griseoincarnatus]
MSDGEQDYGAWRIEQHRRAQTHAFRAAERAQALYEQAIKHEDYVHAHAGSDRPYLRDSVADERRLAEFHGVRSTEALKLATMWAHVAQALADGELPVTSVLEVRGGHDDQGSLSDSLANPDIAGTFR